MEKSSANDMHGALWPIAESERRDRGPVATGTITVSGVPLRIALWSRRIVDKPGSRANGKAYMPVSVEYPKGAAAFLVGVRPADITVTAATASGNQPSGQGVAGADIQDEDLPF